MREGAYLPAAAMKPPPILDLATTAETIGVRLGMPRAEVEAVLPARELEFSGYGKGNMLVSADEWDLELYFATDGAQPLRQIAGDTEGIVWRGQSLIDLRLDAALRALEPCGPALWTPNDAISDAFPKKRKTESPTDEELLSEGTVWLPQTGLGLVILDGEVLGLALRATTDLPPDFAGPVTPAQRELSLNPEIAALLRKSQRNRVESASPAGALRWPRRLLTLGTIVALALIARSGFEEGQRWQQAPQVVGKLLGVEQVQLKQFRDYVPMPLRYLVPPERPFEVEGYRVEFRDSEDRLREVVLERAEFFVPPEPIGAEVTIAVLPGDPPRVKGPSRARDAGFLEYVPVAIVVGALWVISQLLLSFLPMIGRLLARALSPGKAKDPDRPELS